MWQNLEKPFRVEAAIHVYGSTSELDKNGVEAVFEKQLHAFFEQNAIRNTWEVFHDALPYVREEHVLQGSHYIRRVTMEYTPHARVEAVIYVMAWDEYAARLAAQSVLEKFPGQIEIMSLGGQPAYYTGEEETVPRFWRANRSNPSLPILERTPLPLIPFSATTEGRAETVAL